MLIVLFSLILGWLPAIGYASPFDDPVRFLQHACLPAIVMGTDLAAPLTRYIRAEMLEQLNQDYVRTAWAKGLPSRMVIVKHALKNSLIAAVTVVGLQTARLLGGSTIVETVFSWPGVGRLLIEGVYSRDYPIVQGSVLIIAVTYVFINLVRRYRLQMAGPPHQARIETPKMKQESLPIPWTAADSANSHLSRFLDACQVIARNRLALIGVVIVGTWLLTALLAPYMATHDAYEINIANRLKVRAATIGWEPTPWAGTPIAALCSARGRLFRWPSARSFSAPFLAFRSAPSPASAAVGSTRR